MGINVGHDSAAALVINGQLITALSEERVSRIKHDSSFPLNAINCILSNNNLTIDDIDSIGMNMDINYLSKRFSICSKYPVTNTEAQRDHVSKQLKIKEDIKTQLKYKGPIVEQLHHYCHLRATQYQSGFKNALLCSFDGLGELSSASSAIFLDGLIQEYKEYDFFPNSLGLVYAGITNFLGWRNHCDEGIVMGLAPYGDPNSEVKGTGRTYIDLFREIIQLDHCQETKLNLDYFEFQNKRDAWVSDKFKSFFGLKRIPESEISMNTRNIAAGLQARIEEVVHQKILSLRRLYPDLHSLCLSGGLALNCSNNGKLLDSGIFNEIFVQPASSDDGTAIGAALLTSDLNKKGPLSIRDKDESVAYLGPSYARKYIADVVENEFDIINKSVDMVDQISDLLIENKIIGWYQGRSEFGPRALGHRSILAKPYPASNKDIINNRIKFREEFRPFAPVVILEYASEYFKIKQPSPHMLYAIQATDLGSEKCPATVHVDNSARVQTVTSYENNRLHKLITSFHIKTGVPVLLNTSFNVKGQPIVETPRQAIDTFINTSLDCLVIDNYLLLKEESFVKAYHFENECEKN